MSVLSLYQKNSQLLSNIVNPRKLRPVRSNPDSGSKRGVHVKGSVHCILTFIISQLILSSNWSIILLEIFYDSHLITLTTSLK